MTNLENFVLNYVEVLYENNNKWLKTEIQNRFSREDFYNLIKPAVEIVSNNKDVSYEELVNKVIDFSSLGVEIKKLISSGFTPGLVLCASTPNIDIDITSGFTSPSNIKNMEKDIIFDEASVTKMYTSLITMILFSMNKGLSLDDKVTKYAPMFVNLKDVTINDLLTFNVSLITDGRLDDNNISYEEALDRLYKIKVSKENTLANPYSDMGHLVLKYVLEGATGYTLSSLLSVFLCKTYDLNDTFYNVPVNKYDNVCLSRQFKYIDKDGKIISIFIGDVMPSDAKARKLFDKSGSGHAGLFASEYDVNKLCKNLANGKILSEDVMKSFLENATGKYYYDYHYGIYKYRACFGKGIYVAHPHGKGEVCTFQSGGASAGWTGTYAAFDPFNKVSLAFAGNKTFGLSKVLNKEVLVKNDRGISGIYDENGNFLVDCSLFAWKKEKLVASCYSLMLQLRFVEEYVKMYEPNFDTNLKLSRHL